MGYRLLIDLEVVAALDSIPKNVRSRVLDHFVKLRSTPDRYSDYHERDRSPHRGWHLCWPFDSLLDRHFNVLNVKPADL